MRVLGDEILKILLQHSRRDILAIVMLHKGPREAEIALADKKD